ncbi:DUF6520 family protein [Mucilaginibacter agri]|uniref:Uncharacterized protein n=1 Tax=Mucilaginibacter agri TaxID=2695265 RepID=A0A965ZCP5_9SPHI|nr:DUF6520 family protein [Mucilaginibacter agri]NCD68583.1 hypothetical protein [Mucilaginibacter agri]
MKNFKMGLMALALTFAIGAAFSTKATAHKKAFAGLFWYQVDASQKTVGAPIYSNDTKAQALAEPTQDCADVTSTMCQFGSTNGSLPTGTSAAGADVDHRINTTE